MNRTLIALIGSALLSIVLAALLTTSEPRPAPKTGLDSTTKHEPIVLFCAASNRAVMEAIRNDYELEFGTPVQVQYGASQTLLSAIEVSGTGDLYLPADDSFITIARNKSLIADAFPLATMKAVVAVRKGNPKSIKSFADLLRMDVRVVQANPDAAAIGKVVREAFKAANVWDKMAEATTAYRTNVTEVANDIVIGSADTGFVYDAVLYSYPDLEAVTIEELATVSSQVTIGVISATKQPQAAKHFARYVAARDRGLKRYAEQGFVVVADAQVWKESL